LKNNNKFRWNRSAIGVSMGLLLMCNNAHAQDEGDGNTFTLNLKNTDIQSLIATVSKQTGRNFVLDPRVKARVTVISNDPVDADGLYEVFLSVLQVHGYSAVPSGDMIKIVPDVTAKQGPVPLLGEGENTDQLVTQVIKVVNVPAAQLVPILRPMVPQQGHLAAYAATNSLIITDRASNIQRLMEIISRVDKPDNEEIEVARLNHAAASEIVRTLSALQRNNLGGQQGPGAIQLVADERTNSVLISGDRAARIRTRGLIAHLDTPIESGGNTRVVYLKFANAEDMVNILQGVSQGQARVGATTADGSAGGTPTPTGLVQQQIQQQAQQQANPQANILQNNNGSVTPRSAAETGESNVDIQADANTNSLIITAPPDEMNNILAVIRQLDIAGAARANSIPSLGSGLSLALGRFDTGEIDFGILVRAIASDADNNILSTPSIVTLDNEEAEIVVGSNVPFVTGQQLSANNDNPFQTIERRDIGLTLKVKPQINDGNTIKMDLEQEVSNVNTTALTGAADITTSKRSIKTTVLVEDGQTLVLGGLIDDQITDVQEKVPLLGDIPILGSLFRYRNSQKVKRNLMIFLHPMIMRDSDTADQYSNSKYNFLRSRQMLYKQQKNGVQKKQGPELPELKLFFNGKDVDSPLTQFEAPTEQLRLPALVNGQIVDGLTPAEPEEVAQVRMMPNAADIDKVIESHQQQQAEEILAPTTAEVAEIDNTINQPQLTNEADLMTKAEIQEPVTDADYIYAEPTGGNSSVEWPIANKRFENEIPEETVAKVAAPDIETNVTEELADNTPAVEKPALKPIPQIVIEVAAKAEKPVYTPRGTVLTLVAPGRYAIRTPVPAQSQPETQSSNTLETEKIDVAVKASPTMKPFEKPLAKAKPLVIEPTIKPIGEETTTDAAVESLEIAPTKQVIIEYIETVVEDEPVELPLVLNDEPTVADSIPDALLQDTSAEYVDTEYADTLDEDDYVDRSQDDLADDRPEVVILTIQSESDNASDWMELNITPRY